MLRVRFVFMCGLALAAIAYVPPAAGQGHRHRGARHKTHPVKRKSPVPKEVRADLDLGGLVEALKSRGLSVERAGAVEQPFFSAAGRALGVGGGQVQVFQYATAEAARREAARVSPDGSSVGTSMVTWVETPHFFRAGKLIVLYVGSDPKVLEALRATLGARFAGGQN